MPITSQATFLELVDHYHRNPGKFAFFVGAGLSQPAFPSWESLLKRFVEEANGAGMPYTESEMLGYIEKGENFLDIADACVNAMGLPKYRDLMEEIFDKDVTEATIPSAYKELINLAPSTIITTNYDRIPEVAGRGKYRINTNKNPAEAIRSIADEKAVVFKMHGDIVDQSSIVLTTSDYQKITHGDQMTRRLLNTVLSSKYTIFVGFSMSDPHLDDILAKINVASSGIPLSHYLLLNESSAFKANAISNKYGVKVITYTPADNSHSEVIEILRALKHDTAGPDIKGSETGVANLSNKHDLIQHLDKAISEVQLGGAYSVFHAGKTLLISFSPTGQTTSELQNELLSLVRLISFDCNFVDELQLLVIANTRPTQNVNETQQCFLKASIRFLDAQKYARREMSTSKFWTLISFFSPTSITDPFQAENLVGFPMSTSLVGE